MHKYWSTAMMARILLTSLVEFSLNLLSFYTTNTNKLRYLPKFCSYSSLCCDKIASNFQ